MRRPLVAASIAGLLGACRGTASEPDRAPSPSPSPRPAPPVVRAWRYYHVDLDDAYTTDPVAAVVRSDGRIVLHHVLEDEIAMTVDAPAALLAEIDAVAATGPSRQVPGGIVYADTPHRLEGTPDPARERRIVEHVRALAAQRPRRLVPCPPLESTSTAFGVRVVWSKGGRPHEVFEYSAERDEAISKSLAPASRSDHPDIPPTPARSFLQAADIERLRAAVLELDLGRHTDLPTSSPPYVDVELTFPYRPFDGCGRRFAPGLPASGASLEAAVDAIVAKMWR